MVVVAAGKLVIRTRLVCREAAIVLLSAQFFIWPSVSLSIALVSVCCVAVRAVMQFFHVCLFPVVFSVVSVVVPRHVLHPPRILPVVVIHRGVPRIAMPARSRVLLLPFVLGVAVLLVVLVTARAIVGVHRLLLLLGVVPGLADVVPVSFSVTASIAGDTPCFRRPASVGVCWVARALPGARRRCCSARVITARPLSPILAIVGVSQAVASPAVQGRVGTPLFYLESTVLVVSDLALSAVPLNFVSLAGGEFGRNPDALASK